MSVFIIIIIIINYSPMHCWV